MKYLRAVGVCVYTLALYLGLPILGWGWSELAAFFIAPYQLGYAVVVGVFSLVVGIQAYHSLEGIQDSPVQKGQYVHRQSIVGGALIGLLFCALILIPYTSHRSVAVFASLPVLAWVGVVFCAFSYLLIFWSGLALGRQYSAEVTIQKNHQLITSGPYRLIRHPRYLGILCLALGIGLLFHSWIGLGLFPLVCGLVLWRIIDEEALLKQAFGETWCAYSLHSWRLLPYVFENRRGRSRTAPSIIS